MDVKDVVAILEFLPKTILAIAILVAIIVFQKPISERLFPAVRSAEFWGLKLEFVKTELQQAERDRAAIIKAELPWAFTDSAFQVLRDRAERLKNVVPGIRVLWIDDGHPSNNLHERRALGGLGILVDAVRTTDEALQLLKLAPYEVMITNYSRPDDEGALKLLAQVKERKEHSQLIFYARMERAVPAGAHGYTTLPDELLHLVMDLAERRRTVGAWGTRK